MGVETLANVIHQTRFKIRANAPKRGGQSPIHATPERNQINLIYPTMKRLALLFTLALLSSQAWAQSPSQAKIDSIVETFQDTYADTFNRRDTSGMAALLTEDATLQNEWGGVTRGRSAIEAILTKLMGALPEGTTLKDTAVASHSVAPGVIVSQGFSQRLVDGEEPSQMFFSRVLVLTDGEWKLAATQIARPSTVPRP